MRSSEIAIYIRKGLDTLLSGPFLYFNKDLLILLIEGH